MTIPVTAIRAALQRRHRLARHAPDVHTQLAALPEEHSAGFALVANLTAAKASGLTVPRSVRGGQTILSSDRTVE